MRSTFRFKTNIPTTIHFQIDKPMVGTGQFGEWFRYEVVVNDQEQVLFASKGLQQRLASLGDLFGRTLEITKLEGEGNRISWQIKENGIDITPGVGELSDVQVSLPIEKENKKNKNIFPDNDNIENRIKNLEQRLNKASIVVKDLNERLEKAEDELKNIKAQTNI